MILRRITEHVKAQNWFAVALDFIIVVVGVFIGIQVSNWNDVRDAQLSEAQYLERFADDIELTIAHIREERVFATNSLEAIEKFTTQLYSSGVSDKDLVAATNGYLTTGAFFANFSPNRSTFDDLITTGNFDIIADEAIRTGLTSLHARYDSARYTIESNISWVQQGEDRIYYGFDAFRYDVRTQKLFKDETQVSLAENVRENRELLRRHAAFHYWLKNRSIELYDQVEPQAQAVLDLIQAELESR
ncbi:DUF6090 family protein [Hyphococcus sp.]|uniref:DUF6090 family protein n=1 Tax=Hyphococcus sp. TaxID=2038636 RepID=UPI002088B5A6|nr:MAG: hypothetical protein DHS20C04_10100 [Marinicaulis sp.]